MAQKKGQVCKGKAVFCHPACKPIPSAHASRTVVTSRRLRTSLNFFLFLLHESSNHDRPFVTLRRLLSVICRRQNAHARRGSSEMMMHAGIIQENGAWFAY